MDFTFIPKSRDVVKVYPVDVPFDVTISSLIVNKEDIIDRLEPLTIKYFDHFKICPRCERIYWQGTHHEEMKKRLSRIGISTTPPIGQPCN